jgi:hypothetical protein
MCLPVDPAIIAIPSGAVPSKVRLGRGASGLTRINLEALPGRRRTLSGRQSQLHARARFF